MHPDQRALLDTILAYPSEETPRLVYADWLEENGDRRRAAFIRDGVDSGVPQKPSYHWIDYPTDVIAGWQRGFIDEVSCTMGCWMQFAEEIMRWHPVRRVNVTDKSPWYSAPNDEEYYGWWCDHHGSSISPVDIPKETLGAMCDDPRRIKTPVDYRYEAHGGIVAFASDTDAIDALSDACIQFGKGK